MNLTRPCTDKRKLISELLSICFLFSFWALSQSVLATSAGFTTTTGHQKTESLINTDAKDRDEAEVHNLWFKRASDSSSQSHKATLAHEAEGYGIAAALLSTHVEVEVSGPIARVAVAQRFLNPSQYWMEGEYNYPLPDNAAVDRLRMTIGERVIEGEIKEKQQAKKAFQTARQQGKRAGMLTQRRANEFRTQVTNVAPGESVVVTFEYQQWLDYRDGGFDFRFPMVSTPSFLAEQNPSTEAFQDQAPANHFKDLAALPDNPVSVRLTLNAGVPTEMPRSLSHPVEIQQFSETHYEIKLSGKAELSNRDFTLSWSPVESPKPLVSVIREDTDEASYGLLMIVPPAVQDSSEVKSARELILTLDVSGSMQGASLQQAKMAVNKALEDLTDHDLFNVLWFSDRTDALFLTSQIASQHNIALAKRRVEQLSANGGTRILPAVQRALVTSDLPPLFSAHDVPYSKPVLGRSHLAPDETRLRQVVFLTDGAVNNEQAIFNAIHTHLGASRLFTVGIGSAPNAYFMRKAARAGRGTFTYIAKPEEVEDKVGALLDKLRRPALTDVELDFHGKQLDLLPDPLPDVYQGEPVYAVFKAENFPLYAQLSGRLDGVMSYTSLDLEAGLTSGSETWRNAGVATEWARRKVSRLRERMREQTAEQQAISRSELIELALQHKLVTPFTSLVAIEQTPVRAGGALYRHRIPANLPHGWAANMTLAQTASGIWYHLHAGIALVLLAGLLWLGLRYFDKSKARLELMAGGRQRC